MVDVLLIPQTDPTTGTVIICDTMKHKLSAVFENFDPAVYYV